MINVLVGVVGFDLVVVLINFDWLMVDFMSVVVMDEVECFVVLNVGVVVVEDGFDILMLGEMGIGNIIVVVVLCLCSFGGVVCDWVGFGIGVDDVGIVWKIVVVEVGVVYYVDVLLMLFEMLCWVGGCEIVVIVGVVVVVWLVGVLVVLDGFICLLVLVLIVVVCLGIVDYCIVGYCLVELGYW